MHTLIAWLVGWHKINHNFWNKIAGVHVSVTMRMLLNKRPSLSDFFFNLDAVWLHGWYTVVEASRRYTRMTGDWWPPDNAPLQMRDTADLIKIPLYFPASPSLRIYYIVCFYYHHCTFPTFIPFYHLFAFLYSFSFVLKIIIVLYCCKLIVFACSYS